MSSVQEIRSCPACGSSTHEQVGGRATRFACDRGAGWPAHPEYAVRECGVCGLYFKSHTPGTDILASYYAGLDTTAFSVDHQFPTDKHVLARLRELSPGSRVLDYGCNTGRLLGALGPGYDRYGIEVNPDAAAEASRKGISMLSEGSLPERGAFDAIVATDVFEHLLQPTSIMGLLASRLKSGGQLVFVTGLADAIADRDWLAEHWYFRVYGHLQMASRRHIAWLCDRLQLECGRSQVCSHYKRSPGTYARQVVQSISYRAFKNARRTSATRALSWIPVIGRGHAWSNLPSTDQFSDHVVVCGTRGKRDSDALA